MAEARTAAPPRERSGAWEFLRWLINAIISLAFVAATVMAFYNVFGVSIEVERLAGETACQGQPPTCKAQFTMWERTPWAHSFQMYTPTGTKPIKCQREYILYGTWSCVSLDKGTPSSMSFAPAAVSVDAAPPQAVPQSVKPKPAKTPGPATMHSASTTAAPSATANP
jgi:hypothetical protein